MSDKRQEPPTRAAHPGRRRAVIMLVSLPFALASLVVVVKLAGLPVLGGAMVEQYRSGDFVASIESAERLTEGNLFESWVAPFGRGTATAAAGDYNAAIPDLERALELAPESRRCDIAVNLSLSWESLGDSYVTQGLDAGALRLYATAKRVITSAGEECLPPNAPPNAEEDRNAGDELSAASDRLDGQDPGLGCSATRRDGSAVTAAGIRSARRAPAAERCGRAGEGAAAGHRPRAAVGRRLHRPPLVVSRTAKHW